MIKKASIEYAKSISDIYNFSIQNDPYANCNSSLLEISYWEKRIQDPRTDILVKEAEDGTLLGFSVIQPFTVRKQYQNVFEISIYISSDSRGKGFAAEIYFAAINQMPTHKDVYLLALVFAENIQSIRLLKIGGFRTLFKLKEAAYKKSDYRDMVLLVNDFNNVPTEYVQKSISDLSKS